MLSFNRQFWFNTVLFVVACVVLGLSIWALVAKCPENFGNINNFKLKDTDVAITLYYNQMINHPACDFDKKNDTVVCPPSSVIDIRSVNSEIRIHGPRKKWSYCYELS